MSDAHEDVPETITPADGSDVVSHDVAETVIEHPADADVSVEVESPTEPPSVEVEAPVTETDPLPTEEESAVTEMEEEPVTVAADSSPTEETVVKDVEPGKHERRPDARPKRKLGWRAYILGGSGGTR